MNNPNLHSHCHCYLDGFLAVDLSVDCALTMDSGQEFQRPSKVVLPGENQSFLMQGAPPLRSFDPRCVPGALVCATGLVKAKALNGKVGICVIPEQYNNGFFTDLETSRVPVHFVGTSSKPVSVKLKNLLIASPSEASEEVLARIVELQPKPSGTTRAEIFHSYAKEKWSATAAQAKLQTRLEKAGASLSELRIIVSFDN